MLIRHIVIITYVLSTYILIVIHSINNRIICDVFIFYKCFAHVCGLYILYNRKTWLAMSYLIAKSNSL